MMYQGLQFSAREFDELQNRLDRPFGMWNCKHTIYPIILGVSQPANDAAQLAAYRAYSSEEIEIDGRRMTRYEWTQEQRRIETAVRAQKDVAIAARASGDDFARRQAQGRINALLRRYDAVSRSAGLDPAESRMRVTGFRRVKTAEELKRPQKSGIIQVAGQTINPRMRAQKQREHVFGTAEYKRRTEEARANNKPLPSAFYASTDVDALVKAHMGKGTAVVDIYGVVSEFFSSEMNVGQVYLHGSGTYIDTSRVCIRYSKNGWHAFPVKE